MSVAKNVGYGPADARGAEARDRRAGGGGSGPRETPGLRRPRAPATLRGQQQRVALARALVIQPKVLLLDEPFSALDKNLRGAMQVELKEIQRRLGVTTVFVTHDQGEALSLSDRIVVMSAGRIRQVGTPRRGVSPPAGPVRRGFIGDVNTLPARWRPCRAPGPRWRSAACAGRWRRRPCGTASRGARWTCSCAPITWASAPAARPAPSPRGWRPWSTRARISTCTPTSPRGSGWWCGCPARGRSPPMPPAPPSASPCPRGASGVPAGLRRGGTRGPLPAPAGGPVQREAAIRPRTKPAQSSSSAGSIILVRPVRPADGAGADHHRGHPAHRLEQARLGPEGDLAVSLAPGEALGQDRQIRIRVAFEAGIVDQRLHHRDAAAGSRAVISAPNTSVAKAMAAAASPPASSAAMARYSRTPRRTGPARC